MHTKQLGNVGELRIAADLTNQGYYVFTELGDICKSDLIVMGEDYKPIKVQVKYITSKNGAVFLSCNKAGPNYRFRYENKHADVYAIYVPDHDLCLYVSSQELLAQKSTLTLRIVAHRTELKTLIHWASNYKEFKRALRDYTRSIPPTHKVEDDEIVQTATQ